MTSFYVSLEAGQSGPAMLVRLKGKETFIRFAQIGSTTIKRQSWPNWWNSHFFPEGNQWRIHTPPPKRPILQQDPFHKMTAEARRIAGKLYLMALSAFRLSAGFAVGCSRDGRKIKHPALSRNKVWLPLTQAKKAKSGSDLYHDKGRAARKRGMPQDNVFGFKFSSIKPS